MSEQGTLMSYNVHEGLPDDTHYLMLLPLPLPNLKSCLLGLDTRATSSFSYHQKMHVKYKGKSISVCACVRIQTQAIGQYKLYA